MPETTIDMMGMMKECMKTCKPCALMPIIFGGALFLLGYFLEADVVKILWLVFSGLMVLMGVFAFIMMSIMSK
jgi:hypothetical protein